MAVNLIHMKCQNCGANLDIDLDHMMAFCPYCGEKILIDIDQLSSVLVEKEKTNRATKFVNGVENIADKIVEYKTKKEEIKNAPHQITKNEIIALIICVFLILAMMLIPRYLL